MTFEDAFKDELSKISGLKKIPLHFLGGMKEGLKPRKESLKDIIEAVSSKAFKAGFPTGRAIRRLKEIFQRKG